MTIRITGPVSAGSGSSSRGRLNMGPTALPRFRRGLANVLSGTSDCKVCMLGDSTFGGVGSEGNTATGNVRSIPRLLAKMLNARGIPAANGLGIPGSSLANLTDNRWTPGSGWSPSGQGAAGGASYVSGTSDATTLVYADPLVTADRFDIYYLSDPSFGTLASTATGGSAVNTNTSAASGVLRATASASAAAASNTVSMTHPSGGAVFVVGVEPWQSTVTKVRIANMGVGSAKLHGNWVGGNAAWGGMAFLQAYAPDLTIISLGINDAYYSVAAADYAADLATLIGIAKLSGDVLLMPPLPSRIGLGAPALALESSYTSGIRNSTETVADYTARIVDGSTANALGFMSDDLHMNALGYADVAQFLTETLMTI